MTSKYVVKNECFLNSLNNRDLCLFSEWIYNYTDTAICPVHLMDDLNRILKDYEPARILSLVNDAHFDLYDSFFTLNYDEYIISTISSFDNLDDYKIYLILECSYNEIDLKYLYDEYKKASNNNNLEKIEL